MGPELTPPMRFLLAAAIIVAYIVFTVAVLRAHRRKAGAHGHSHGGGPQPLLVAYASQTGYAEQLAKQTAHTLQSANIPARVRELADISANDLASTERALFIVSTYGEGDPPDSGLTFVHKVMSQTAALSNLRFGVLALGDRTYANFTEFGRTLERWLRRHSAQPLFDRIDVDNADEAALIQWQRQLGVIAARTDLPLWSQPRFERWKLTARRHLNPGSAGMPCFHIELKPIDAPRLKWSAGDIAILTPPGSNPREYSIASMPSEGALSILVRQSRRPDGSLGVASGWLTSQAEIGTEVPLRIRTNNNFHSPEAAVPIVLIGNGTGIAGLRSHLKAREAVPGGRNWLFFGERNAAFDAFYREDIDRWKASGLLTRVDLVYSRDQDERLYVQHAVQRNAAEIRAWVSEGAVIYVCGSATGMAQDVDDALAVVLGREALDSLIEGASISAGCVLRPRKPSVAGRLRTGSSKPRKAPARSAAETLLIPAQPETLPHV